MTNLNNGFYNFTFTSAQTTQKEIYQDRVFCTDGLLNDTSRFSHKVTRTGTILTSAQSFIYVLVSILIFIFFSMSLYMAIIIPYGNKVDGGGAVFKVSKTKYIKLGFVILTYSLLIWVLNISIAISDSFLTLGLFFGFASFFFNLLIRLSFPFGIFILILMLFEIVRDANIQKRLELFGRIR